MDSCRHVDRITCAYLYTISKYGYPPDLTDTRLHIKEMADLGFTSIELEGIGKDNIEYLFRNRREIAAILLDHACTLPVLCIVLPDLSSVDKTRRDAALELFEQGCETAQYLGAPAVLDNGPLLNLGNFANAPIKRHYSQDYLLQAGLSQAFEWTDYWKGLVATYRQACQIAANYHLTYQMHPCEGSLITNTDSFVNFSEAVNSPNLMFNLDTANQYYFKDNLALSILRLSERINYIHISDNGGSRVEHLVPGNGKINWDLFFTTLKKVGYKGQFAIDVGGDETGIKDLEEAYRRSAKWLDEQLQNYLLNC